MKTKVCNTCGQELPFDKFYRHSTSADGRKGRCIACTSAYRKAKRVLRPKKEKPKPRVITSIPKYVTKIEKIEVIGVPGAKYSIRVTCDNDETYTRSELAKIFHLTREGIALRIKTCGLNNDIIFLEKDEYKRKLKEQRGKDIEPADYDKREWGTLSKLSGIVRSENLAKLKPIGKWERLNA